MNICKSLNYKFAHHHLHTEYSPLDAPVTLKKLVDYSDHLGYKTITVTDHGTVSSWVKLSTLCKEKGIKPIFGIEGYFSHKKEKEAKGDNYHIVLLAKNNEGIKNIYRMSQAAWIDGFYRQPRIDWDLLEKHHEGVICTTACVGGLIPDVFRSDEIPEEQKFSKALEYAKRFQGIFGQDFYAEVQYHGIPEIEKKAYEGVAKIAKELNLKILGTNDVHYLRKEDANTQEVMMSVCTGKCIKDPNRMKHEQSQLYLKSQDEMLDIFGGKNSAAVQGALEIADICNAELEFGKVQLPSIEIPKEYKSDMEYLEELAREGLRRINKEGDPVYEARFKEEFRVIKSLKEKGRQFDRYFLAVWDYVNWAWNNGIRVGVGRGSGAGSLLLYCLRITGIDPLKYDLLFERFLDEDRNEMPDIDIDFDSENGYKVYEYVCQKYGKDKVSRIGTFGTYGVAAAIKTAFKVFDPGNNWEKEQDERMKSAHNATANKHKGFKSKETPKTFNETYRLSDDVTKHLPRHGGSENPDPNCTFSKQDYDKKPDELIYIYNDPYFQQQKSENPEIFNFAEHIEGMVSSKGQHAAGVLITQDPMVDVCPQQRARSNDSESEEGVSYATVYDMNDCDKLGLVKFDFLQTKVLSVFNRTLKTIEDRTGKKLDIDSLVPDDRSALDFFTRGDTLAIFQFESNFMINTLRDMRADCFNDIVAANALGRPGPMQYIPLYCELKKGVKKPEYEVPVLESILGKTYGIMVYQEQVMKITRALAGFTGSEADKVRKAMGKKKKEILDQMEAKFIDGCRKTKTCSDEIARSIWNSASEFSKYAFNLSHSAGYSYTAYQCAYLKAYYPAEYMAAHITVESETFSNVEKYESGIKKMGLKLLPVDVNLSKLDYKVCDVNGKSAIRKGFKGVKGCRGNVGKDIESNAPYKDMYDYCMRSGIGSGKGAVEALNEAGAFDWLLPKLTKKLSREAKRDDILTEYATCGRRADATKKEKGARKQEMEGIKSIFGIDEDEVVIEEKKPNEFVLGI